MTDKDQESKPQEKPQRENSRTAGGGRESGEPRPGPSRDPGEETSKGLSERKESRSDGSE